MNQYTDLCYVPYIRVYPLYNLFYFFTNRCPAHGSNPKVSNPEAARAQFLTYINIQLLGVFSTMSAPDVGAKTYREYLSLYELKAGASTVETHRSQPKERVNEQG